MIWIFYVTDLIRTHERHRLGLVWEIVQRQSVMNSLKRCFYIASTCASCCINKLPNCRELLTFTTLRWFKHEKHFTITTATKNVNSKPFSTHLLISGLNIYIYIFFFYHHHVHARLKAHRPKNVMWWEQEVWKHHLHRASVVWRGFEIISERKASDSSQLEPPSLHLLCISWGGLSSIASQSWLSVKAEDVSPVSLRPVWVPLTNVTAVPPGYTADNSTVC